jgi:L-iditol 2-dehydrogenase
MKALVLTANNRLQYLDWQDPVPAANEVLIQVRACSICGSDVRGMDGSTGRRIPPIIMGHEAAGVIVEVGKAAGRWSVGTPVTFESTIYPLDDWYTRKGLYNLCDNRVVFGASCAEFQRHGAFADLVAVPEHVLFRIPEGVSFNQAAMVEPGAIAAHAVSLLPVQLNDSVVVVGAGIIGLCLIQILGNVGCGKIIAIDLDEGRLQLARDLGADFVLQADDADITESVFQQTNGRGADLAFDALGNGHALQRAVSCVRKGGAVGLLGNISTHVEIALPWVVSRQIRLQGCCAMAGEYPAILDMIQHRSLDVDSLLSAVAPLAEGAEWFKRLYNKEQKLLKVILQP